MLHNDPIYKTYQVTFNPDDVSHSRSLSLTIGVSNVKVAFMWMTGLELLVKEAEYTEYGI